MCPKGRVTLERAEGFDRQATLLCSITSFPVLLRSVICFSALENADSRRGRSQYLEPTSIA
jgi:hypothetical protein